MFQKDMRLSLLLDFYGEILSQRRRELITLYYDEDFSLSEIAEHTGISRQGVRDSIKKSEQELLHLEEKLALASRFENLQKQIDEICEHLLALSKDHADLEKPISEIAKKLKELSI
ncbi:MAG: DNA-binding protein [Clostridiales bacterium]|nr:DNA-binding protein [Clostridiales bacterium]